MKKRARRNRYDEAGFTLIETLIAVILMVGILAALATITSQWLPNWNRGFARIQRAELLGQSLERLVADLAAAEFVTVTTTVNNNKVKQPLFDGSELAVYFVRSAIGPNSRPGLEFVRVSTTSDDRGTALVRMRAPFVPLRPNARIIDVAGFSDPVVLVRLPYRAVFSYAGPDHVWQNTWRNADQLPREIRVSIRDAATQQALAISTALMLHVGASAECVTAQSPRDCIFPPPKGGPNANRRPANSMTSGGELP